MQLTRTTLCLVALVACKHGKTAVDLDAGGDDPVDAGVPDVPEDPRRQVLADGWRLRAAAEVGTDGAAISRTGFGTEGWTGARLPSTVLAALVAAGEVADPFVGDNLLTIDRARFAGPWWYRSEVVWPGEAGESYFLALEGINYRAEVWLNGQKVAGEDEVVGTFVRHEWDVTELVVPGAANALAIRVAPPDLERDLTITWRDWNPEVPDRNMGVWQDVVVRRSGALALRETRVRSQVSGQLSVDTEVVNTADTAITGQVVIEVDGQRVERAVEVAANARQPVSFDIQLRSPRLWWPVGLGKPELYVLTARVDVDGEASDAEAVRFGVRELRFDVLPGHDARVLSVNGKRLLVRGGGWASDLLLRPASPERLAAELAYTLDLGLNTIRLEGKLERDAFYDRADELGLLTLPGWMCCDRWEHWEEWSSQDRAIAKASMASQARRLRNHASVASFMIGSDKPPPGDVDAAYREALQAAGWSAPVWTSAAGDGVKMRGPYDWVAPSYWYLDDSRGGAHGFNTESGPGPAIPELDSLEAMLSPSALDALWQDPDASQLHAGHRDSPFDNVGLFAEALRGRHGAPTSLEDFVRKAQLMAYEAERAPYEAYAREQFDSATGFVHWLLNNAWPSLIWNLYGYDLLPAAGYFGARKANEPLHVQYSYDDGSVVVVNRTTRDEDDLTVGVKVLDLDGSERFSATAETDAPADSARRVTDVPEPGQSGTYFVALELRRGGEVLSHNLYWLSRREELLDFARGDWYHTPTQQFADYTALNTMPAADLDVDADFGPERVVATLHNPSTTLAFFVRLTLRDEAGRPLVPVLWSDNYVSLLPGETRVLDARYHAADAGGATPTLEVSGWNVERQVKEDHP